MDTLDLELPPLPSPSAPDEAEREAPTDWGDSSLDLDMDELPPLEEPGASAAPSEAAAAGWSLDAEPAGLESADLESALPPLDDVELESADLESALPTLEDVELDMDSLEADAAQAVRAAEGETPGSLAPKPPGEPPPALDLDSLGELPPLPDLEPTAPASGAQMPAIVRAPPGSRSAPPGQDGTEAPPRLTVPGQAGWFTDRRRVLALVAVAGVLLGALVGWGGWLLRGTDREHPFAFEFGRVHQLALQDDLAGRTVRTRGGTTLFVVEGSLINRFPPGTRIGWIRVRGTVYADRGQSQAMGSAQAYLGNVLTERQLEAMTPEAIAAFGAYNNGRGDVNFDIPSGASVPFQLVFPGVTAPVARTVAQIIGYTRDGLSVYLDAQVNGRR
jgi:hypothetical protein